MTRVLACDIGGTKTELEPVAAARPTTEPPRVGPGPGFLGDFNRTLREELRRHALDARNADHDADPQATGESFGSALSRRIFEDVQRAIEDRSRERSERRRERDADR